MTNDEDRAQAGACVEVASEPWPRVPVPPRGVRLEEARAQMTSMRTAELRDAIGALRRELGIPGDIGHVGCGGTDDRRRVEGDLSALLVVRSVEDEMYEPQVDSLDAALPSLDELLCD